MIENTSKPYIEIDEFNKTRNPELFDIVSSFIANKYPSTSVEESDLIIVIGGDGSLLKAIKKYKHLNIPFLGINGGTIGYLLNNIDCDFRSTAIKSLKKEFERGFDILSFPILEFEATSDDGRVVTDTAFNDVWIERSTRSALKMNVKVNEYDMGKLIIGDGMLFSTPAGSTAYAKHLRGIIMPYSLKAYQMVPIACGVDKGTLRALPLNFGDVTELTIMDTDFRKGRLYFDGDEASEDFYPSKLVVKKAKQKVNLAFFSERDFAKAAFTSHFRG